MEAGRPCSDGKGRGVTVGDVARPKPDLQRYTRAVLALAMGRDGLTPSWARPQLDPSPPKRGSDGRVGDTKLDTDPRKRLACGIEFGRFAHLLIIQALAANEDAPRTEHIRNSGLGDAVAMSDLLGSGSRLVPTHNIGHIIGPQEALGARFWAVLGQPR